MARHKDPAIKLFGKTIQLGYDSNADSGIASKIDHRFALAAATTDADCGCSDQSIPCSKQGENSAEEKSSTEEPTNSKIEEERSSSSVIEDCKTPPSPSTPTESPKSLSKKDDQSDQTSSTQSQDQNPPKKPDKILPCPRCNSMNTKFCYFNNYNVNQPRHFCKNCQRYWTAGGTMRNVPVGAGRRKNKSSSSASHHRTLVIPAPPNGLIHQTSRPNGSILTFGLNSSLSESMPSILNLVEKPQPCTPNGKENLSSLYPIPWESRFPVSLYSAQPNWTSRTWNLQWVPAPQSYPDQASSTTNPSPSSLGKHGRDGGLLKVCSSNKEKVENQRLVIPKTLRIDDPTEAAKSSIWDTLGIKNDKVGSSNGGGFFKGLYQSKGIIDHERSDPSVEGSYMVLQANPAALSRSMAFHESAHPSC